MQWNLFITYESNDERSKLEIGSETVSNLGGELGSSQMIFRPSTHAILKLKSSIKNA